MWFPKLSNRGFADRKSSIPLEWTSLFMLLKVLCFNRMNLYFCSFLLPTSTRRKLFSLIHQHIQAASILCAFRAQSPFAMLHERYVRMNERMNGRRENPQSNTVPHSGRKAYTISSNIDSVAFGSQLAASLLGKDLWNGYFPVFFFGLFSVFAFCGCVWSCSVLIWCFLAICKRSVRRRRVIFARVPPGFGGLSLYICFYFLLVGNFSQ